MKSMLSSMKKRNSGIPEDILPVFESIIQKYAAQGSPSLRSECEKDFVTAMEEHLTKEQCFRLYEQNGSCKGTGYDKERKAFALEHADKPLAERLELFCKTFGRNAVFNDDNTITVSFACTHGYYRRALEGKYLSPLDIIKEYDFGAPSVESYFEKCAGGRLYEYQKALGIKLRIKSVDVSPLAENTINPVGFTFEVIE